MTSLTLAFKRQDTLFTTPSIVSQSQRRLHDCHMTAGIEQTFEKAAAANRHEEKQTNKKKERQTVNQSQRRLYDCHMTGLLAFQS